jgi:hypothetical protein
MAYTTIDDPSAHFQTTLYSGDGSTQSITNGGNSDLQPDWVWIKERSASDDHKSYDSSRGTTKKISQNDGSAEENQEGLTAFNSDGFSLGSHAGSNQSGQTYVAWQWKANGGSRTTNAEDGNNPAGGYQANTTAGFSIVDYTGTGAAGTMAHGLGAAPDLIIIKNRDEADSWAVYHSANTAAPETDYLILDTTAGTADDAAWWNDTAPTSTVFTVNTDHSVNADGETYVAYCFTSIQGYSKFGIYTGNGNADGPFVYTGFRPAFVMLKRYDSGTNSWYMWDNQRNPFNAGADDNLWANNNSAENTDDYGFDALSNGFKIRATSTNLNADGGTYIYMAFAEQPFVTSDDGGSIPCTAR